MEVVLFESVDEDEASDELSLDSDVVDVSSMVTAVVDVVAVVVTAVIVVGDDNRLTEVAFSDEACSVEDISVEVESDNEVESTVVVVNTSLLVGAIVSDCALVDFVETMIIMMSMRIMATPKRSPNKCFVCFDRFHHQIRNFNPNEL